MLFFPLGLLKIDQVLGEVEQDEDDVYTSLVLAIKDAAAAFFCRTDIDRNQIAILLAKRRKLAKETYAVEDHVVPRSPSCIQGPLELNGILRKKIEKMRKRLHCCEQENEENCNGSPAFK